MSKQQKLSPKEYIRTKARSLPLYKCLVNKHWEVHSMAHVTVMRRHVNGNCTAGIYLVDLLCLGIKDTAFFFNEPEDEILENVAGLYDMEEISYELAHNIIYAGYDFATNFGIKPHKDFELTKYILEEDTDAIPLIDIHTGDENGIPHLMVSKEYNYRPVLQKLREHAGEGNYFFTLADDLDDPDDDWDEDDDEDEDMEDEEWEDDDDELEEEMLDFDKVSILSDEELTDTLEASTSYLSEKIITVELLWRKLEKEKPLVMLSPGLMHKDEMYKAFERRKDRWESSYEKSRPLLEKLFEELKTVSGTGTSIDKYLELMEKYRDDEYACVMIFAVISAPYIIQNFEVFEKKFLQYPKALQLNIAAYAALLRKKDTVYHFIFNADNVEEAYPAATITGYDHKCFWLIKAFLALEKKNTDDILLYHSLLRISGVGGHLKFLYAAQMEHWLKDHYDLHIA